MSELRITLDAHTKKQAESLFKNMGTNLNSAVKMFVHQALNEGGFPFKPYVSRVPNKETVEAIEEISRGGGKNFSTKEEFYKDLGI